MRNPRPTARAPPHRGPPSPVLRCRCGGGGDGGLSSDELGTMCALVTTSLPSPGSTRLSRSRSRSRSRSLPFPLPLSLPWSLPWSLLVLVRVRVHVGICAGLGRPERTCSARGANGRCAGWGVLKAGKRARGAGGGGWGVLGGKSVRGVRALGRGRWLAGGVLAVKRACARANGILLGAGPVCGAHTLSDPRGMYMRRELRTHHGFWGRGRGRWRWGAGLGREEARLAEGRGWCGGGRAEGGHGGAGRAEEEGVVVERVCARRGRAGGGARGGGRRRVRALRGVVCVPVRLPLCVRVVIRDDGAVALLGVCRGGGRGRVGHPVDGVAEGGDELELDEGDVDHAALALDGVGALLVALAHLLLGAARGGRAPEAGAARDEAAHAVEPRGVGRGARARGGGGRLHGMRREEDGRAGRGGEVGGGGGRGRAGLAAEVGAGERHGRRWSARRGWGTLERAKSATQSNMGGRGGGARSGMPPPSRASRGTRQS
ncbi:hypothetical protein DAEQUDRAFT_430757 [Daedalea quercina L-15889]|uniref:Uncharacterized protein n=1 Tax=Daedalea quercina L-15889 TaxID=1314783 RepID=A0A165NFU3_9APHY|nr:hypothetical protein DAEQUDRAFT_430757 [Daedalea quercina L-15889]